MSFDGQDAAGWLHKVESPTPGKPKESSMPIILWLLGVPLSIVLLLMLFGVL